MSLSVTATKGLELDGPVRPRRRTLAWAMVGSLVVHLAVLQSWPADAPVRGAANDTLTVSLLAPAPQPRAAAAASPVPPPGASGHNQRQQQAPAAKTPHSAHEIPVPTTTTVAVAASAANTEGAQSRTAGSAARASRETPTDTRASNTEDVRPRLQDLLYAYADARKSYPLLARKKNWQGDVKLAMQMHPNGDVHEIQIMESSGFSILDKAAIRLVEQFDRQEEARKRLRGQAVDLTLKIAYRLQ